MFSDDVDGPSTRLDALPDRRQLLPRAGVAAQSEVIRSMLRASDLYDTFERFQHVAIALILLVCFYGYCSLAYIMASLGRPLALRRSVCTSCAKPWSKATPGLQNSDRIQRRSKYYIAPAGEQARPITGFYAGKSTYALVTYVSLTVCRNAKERPFTSSNNFK